MVYLSDAVNIPAEDNELAVVPLREMVIFPQMMTPVYVDRPSSLRALDTALQSQRVLVLTQKDPEVEVISPEDLYDIGTEIAISRRLRMPDGAVNILAQGQQRVEVLEYVQREPYLVARVRRIAEPDENGLPIEALMRVVRTLFEKCADLNEDISNEALLAAANAEDASTLSDLIASSIDLDVAMRQELLETIEPSVRLQKLGVVLANELDVLELEDSIQSQVQEEVDKSQREYYLREQMRVIQEELGQIDPQMREVEQMRTKLEEIGLPEEVHQKALQELDRLSGMSAMMPENTVIRTYLEWILALPWRNETTDNLDVEWVGQVLDRDHYGLAKAKERVLEYIAVRKLAANRMRSPILCFVGPPGTGKTSLGKSIAEALNRRFVRVSLGGIRDEAEIRGHRRTYVGALPGRIIQAMRRAETTNPIFMLDEIDKLGYDFQGDPSAALLEVLDPEQNHAFSDHYMEVPYDLSKVMFITTANILDPIPPALRDRLEVIEFPGYIEEEKIQIAKQFLIPKQWEMNGIAGLHFTEKALQGIIREYTSEAGVRNLDREISSICRKVARRVAAGKRVPQTITEQQLERYLGPPYFIYGLPSDRDEVGVAVGLAWTEAGGEIMEVEATVMDGKGNLLLTGQLGDVMQESAQTALSFARSRAESLGLDEETDFDKLDIHIHVPEGAVPKDGPSAGITLAIALISALTGDKVRRDVAMTGEITLRGRVLPVGGFRDKVLAAYRAGVRTVIVPARNKRDLVDLPRKVQRSMNLVWVEQMDQVLDVALLKTPEESPEPASE